VSGCPKRLTRWLSHHPPLLLVVSRLRCVDTAALSCSLYLFAFNLQVTPQSGPAHTSVAKLCVRRHRLRHNWRLQHLLSAPLAPGRLIHMPPFLLAATHDFEQALEAAGVLGTLRTQQLLHCRQLRLWLPAAPGSLSFGCLLRRLAQPRSKAARTHTHTHTRQACEWS
jgi:hypothetical protein